MICAAQINNEMSCPNPNERRLTFCLLFHCVGRGIELRFVNWANIRWDSDIRGACLEWMDEKNQTQDPMTIFIDYFNWEQCVTHALVCFQISGEAKNFVSYSSAGSEEGGNELAESRVMKAMGTVTSCATTVSGWLKDLTKLVGKPIDGFTSNMTSKAFRAGAASLMANHYGLLNNLLEALRGGWAIETNLSEYVHATYAGTAPGGKALAGAGLEGVVGCQLPPPVPDSALYITDDNRDQIEEFMSNSW